MELAGRGDLAGAKASFKRALDAAPNKASAHANYALILAQLDDDTAGARTHFEAALRLDPTHREANKGLALALLRQGDRKGAARLGRIGFAGGAEPSMYRGKRRPVSVLLLKSALQNISIDRVIDERTFQTWTLMVEFFDPAVALPPHEVVLSCVGDPDLDRGQEILDAVDAVLARTRARVVNPPARIRPTGRVSNARRLREVPGVVTASTALWSRAALAAKDAPEALAKAGFTWPLLVRSPGFQTGHHFEKIDAPGALAAAVAKLPGDELLVIQFIDTRSPDGQFRKYRVMFIGGQLYPLHLAVSASWKVHYFSADMAGHPEHRAEDEALLRDMPRAVGPRVVETLERIQALLGLDYGGIDFAIDARGQVVVFEANASMLIAAVGADPRWAYRAPAVARATEAVQRLLRSGG
jgi:tetratricopeptide (TPR) repeat protein